MKKEIEIKRQRCCCGANFNAAQHLGPAALPKPVPGHIMICADCYALYIWQADETMRPVTDKDIAAIKAIPMKWFKIQMAIRDLQSKNPKMN